jgi:biopolymer transport protein ExbD
MISARRRRLKKPLDADVDLTPMLDIVFIMLIFFIVSAVFLDERGIDLTQSTGEVPTTLTKSISVYVFADGSANVDGYRTDVQSVPARVEMIRAAKPNAAVSLRAEHDTVFDTVVFLEDQFKKADIPTSLRIQN